jgi:hypothetical protein
MDGERSCAHDVVIRICHILARNAGKVGENVSWQGRIGSDRKSIGTSRV